MTTSLVIDDATISYFTTELRHLRDLTRSGEMINEADVSRLFHDAARRQKTIITDDMVERACAAGSYGTGHEIMRMMLEAALNPPLKPEITVTPEMLKAGEDEFQKYRLTRDHNQDRWWTILYRVIRALEPEVAPTNRSQHYSGKNWHHSRADDWKHPSHVHIRIHRREGE